MIAFAIFFNMTQQEALDRLNQMDYSAISYFIYSKVFCKKPKEIADGRDLKIKTVYKNIEKSNKVLESVDCHDEWIAILQEAFNQVDICQTKNKPNTGVFGKLPENWGKQ